jgi:hypothetical protein
MAQVGQFVIVKSVSHKRNVIVMFMHPLCGCVSFTKLHAINKIYNVLHSFKISLVFYANHFLGVQHEKVKLGYKVWSCGYKSHDLTI